MTKMSENKLSFKASNNQNLTLLYNHSYMYNTYTNISELAFTKFMPHTHVFCMLCMVWTYHPSLSINKVGQQQQK